MIIASPEQMLAPHRIVAADRERGGEGGRKVRRICCITNLKVMKRDKNTESSEKSDSDLPNS